ncbi:hypothetical protein GTQ40_10505 [Flavobacteriaceae bacterium R38]|nr:hypothetical protein [Flavobacteriaceae bacterium R38]
MKSFLLKNLWLPIVLAVISVTLSLTFDLQSKYDNSVFKLLLVGLLVFIIVLILELLIKIYYELHEDSINKTFSSLKAKIPDDFKFIFDEYFNGLISKIESATIEQKMEINETHLFKDFYKRILRSSSQNGKIKFFATSLMDPKYFWGESIEKNSIEEKTKEFIERNGPGSFERIFILYEKDLKNPSRIEQVIKIQKEIGVVPFTIHADQLENPKHKKLILVSNNKKIAWQVLPDGDNSINQIDITVDKLKIDHFLKIYNEIKSNSALINYSTNDNI